MDCIVIFLSHIVILLSLARSLSGHGREGHLARKAAGLRQVAKFAKLNPNIKCNKCDFALSHAANLRKHMDGQDMDQMANNAALHRAAGHL